MNQAVPEPRSPWLSHGNGISRDVRLTPFQLTSGDGYPPAHPSISAYASRYDDRKRAFGDGRVHPHLTESIRGRPFPSDTYCGSQSTFTDMGVSDFDPEAGGPEYLYNRLVAHIEGLIAENELKPGTRLPGERDFAKQFGVSIGTARHAVQILRDRGLISTLPAKGHFISALPPDHPLEIRRREAATHNTSK